MRTTTTTTTTQLVLLLTSLVFPLLALAQFGQFFEQMFHGDRSHHHHHHQHHHHNQREQDVASDAAWYRKMYDSGKYFPHLILLSPPPFPYAILPLSPCHHHHHHHHYTNQS